MSGPAAAAAAYLLLLLLLPSGGEGHISGQTGPRTSSPYTWLGLGRRYPGVLRGAGDGELPGAGGAGVAEVGYPEISVHTGDPAEQEENPYVSFLRQYLYQARSRRAGSGPCGRGRCRCYSKVTRRSFCCDCMTGPCFPGSAAVTVHDDGAGGEPAGSRRRRRVDMEHLRVGHVVSTVVDGAVVGSEVIGFLDRRAEEVAEYLYLSTADGSTVAISPGHLIYVARNDTTPTALDTVYAKEVTPGDHLLVALAEGNVPRTSVVTRIRRRVVKGAFVPLTRAGTLVVDDVLVSCYSSFPHGLAHLVLTPLRWLPNVFLPDQQNGVNLYVKWMKYLGNLLLPDALLPDQTSEMIKFESDDDYQQQMALFDKEWSKNIALQCRKDISYA